MYRIISTILFGVASCTNSLFALESSIANANSERDQAVASAVQYLRSVQADDGSFSKNVGIGPTALVATALLENGLKKADPLIRKSLDYVKQAVQPDGGIYSTGSNYRNYETSLCLLCFAAANGDGEFDADIKQADAFLKDLQWDESEDKDPSDASYGGGGYGRSKRPDLSNTSFLVDALKSAGNDGDSEALQRALKFVSRCQNLESPHNTTSFASRIGDGGFYYTPVGEGSSPAGTTANGGLRSYGAMTYAGLKSMLYANVSKDDPRVKAAILWATNHYTLDENPGMGKSGLFYYYHVFAKAFDAYGETQIRDKNGETHQWQKELVDQLVSLQRRDGSWINENDRWMEGDPNLATGFALLALAHCQ